MYKHFTASSTRDRSLVPVLKTQEGGPKPVESKYHAGGLGSYTATRNADLDVAVLLGIRLVGDRTNARGFD